MAKIPMMKKVQQLRSLSALWKHRRQLYNMLREMVRGTYKATMLTVVAMVAALIYLFSPFNLLTDLVPVIGWIDDGFIIYFLLKRLMYELERYEISRSQLELVKQ